MEKQLATRKKAGTAGPKKKPRDSKPPAFIRQAASKKGRRNRGLAEEFWGGGNSGFMPMFSHNQYNDDDYDILEDLWSHTIGGAAIDIRTDYMMGQGLKPVAKWKNPKKHGKDADSQQRKIEEEYGDLVDQLIEIDKRPKIRLFENVRDAVRWTMVFGRAVIAFEGDDDLPFALKPIHPRFVGRVFHHQDDLSLSSVQIFIGKEGGITYDDEMIYLVNNRHSPRFRNVDYGFSMLQRVAGQCRALREITEFDIPEIVKSMYAGYGVIMVDQEKLTEPEKLQDMNTILSALKPGTFSVLTKQGEKSMDFQSFNLDPRVGELTQVFEMLTKSVVGHFQVPGFLVGREEESNRATAVTKMRSFLHGPVRQDRTWLASILAKQWYERNIAAIDPKALDEIYITVEFEDIPVDSWMGAIEELAKLKELIPLPDQAIADMADLSHLKDIIAAEGEKRKKEQEEQQQQQMAQQQEQQGHKEELDMQQQQHDDQQAMQKQEHDDAREDQRQEQQLMQQQMKGDMQREMQEMKREDRSPRRQQVKAPKAQEFSD